MSRILCVANQKGGVGKTTTAVNLAVALAKSGGRTLLVDLDPQCNATGGLGLRPADRHPLVSDVPLRESVVATAVPNLDMLPGSRRFEDVEFLAGADARQSATLVRHMETGLNLYDFVLIDCPPSLGALTRTALSGATEVVMPIQCEYFAMEGLTQMIEVIRDVMKLRPQRLRFGGILLTMYDHELELTREVDAEVRDFFGDVVFSTVIPRDVAVSEAPSHGLSVLDYARRAVAHGPTLNFVGRYSIVAKERRLGRGLEALLGMTGEPIAGNIGPATRPDAGHAGTPRPAADGLLQLDVGEIEANPFQPRRDFDDTEIATLADSIRTHGLISPIAVREVGGRYQLIAGERRLRAAMEAGWKSVPARVIEADDRLATELAIVENLRRKDLNPVEKAISFRQYIERYGCTQDELAGRLQINRSTVANFIRLLELPGEVQQAVRDEKITYGHARALLPLGDEREQLEFCRRIQSDGLSVRAVEDLVQDVVHAADAEPLGPIGPAEAAPKSGSKSKPTKSKTTASLEQSLRLALGTRVDVRTGGKGRGKIVVHFTNNDEFERLFQFLTGPQFKTEAS